MKNTHQTHLNRNFKGVFKAVFVASIALGTSAAALAETTQRTSTGGAVPANTSPDNSAVNQMNNGAKGVSADQQSNSQSDLEVAQKIRRSITQEKNLSTYAHNIKIITQGGSVILKGPVRSAEEKATVENKAAVVAGKDHVKSELQVVPR